MLTKDRLKKKVIEWRDVNHCNASNDAIDRLCESLVDEVVEIAKETYQRGIKGEVF